MAEVVLKVPSDALRKVESAKEHLAEEVAFAVCRALGHSALDRDFLRDRRSYEQLCEAIERMIP